VNWPDVLRQDQIYLNLGGGGYCHPLPGYENYISVDENPSDAEWVVKHDLRKPMPIPDACVSRIHTEDFIEHIYENEISPLLAECYRVLKHGGFMRIGVPDYNNPKDVFCLKAGHDPRWPKHRTLTTFPLITQILKESPFSRFVFYAYWDQGRYNSNEIDYSKGMIRRTPDHDSSCRVKGIGQYCKRVINDARFIAANGLGVNRNALDAQWGHRLHTTSLVADAFKP
jgi:predicted SAM-dependent methyltransferase